MTSSICYLYSKLAIYSNKVKYSTLRGIQLFIVNAKYTYRVHSIELHV